MIQYPVGFDTEGEASCGIATRWDIRSAEHQAVCAIPPEFEGPGGAFSPEDFFAQALTNCFIATFQVMAEKSRITFERLSVHGHLIVDRDETKRPFMKEFHLRIKLATPSDSSRATTLVKKAMENGFILNSVKTKVSYDLEIL